MRKFDVGDQILQPIHDLEQKGVGGSPIIRPPGIKTQRKAAGRRKRIAMTEKPKHTAPLHSHQREDEREDSRAIREGIKSRWSKMQR